MKRGKTVIVFVLFAAAVAVAASAQTTVFVAGNTNGAFGNPIDLVVPLVPAITVSGPATITVTYVSGTVSVGPDLREVGPNGKLFDCGRTKQQLALEEARGIAGVKCKAGALIGVFVPAWRVNHSGFTAVDGTKNAASVGIMPGGLFFVGTGKTFDVTQAGTLFLGINDTGVGDNTGGFTVEVTGP